MPDMFGLPPPGLTAQMPLDPSQLFLQKRPPAPSAAELAQMKAMGEVMLAGMAVDSLSSALDASAVVGSAASKTADFKPPPAPTPPAPNAGLIGGKGPVNTIAEASPTGRGNPWFNANPIVAFLINYMNCVRTQMLTKLVDGLAVVKSMNMNMELARGLYDTQIAIGEIKKQEALNEAAALIAQAVMQICSAAFAVGVHIKSIASNPIKGKPGGQGEASTAGNKKATDEPDSLTPTGLTGTAKSTGSPEKPKATFEEVKDNDLASSPSGSESKQKMTKQTEEFGKNLQESDKKAAERNPQLGRRDKNGNDEFDLLDGPNGSIGKSRNRNFDANNLETPPQQMDNPLYEPNASFKPAGNNKPEPLEPPSTQQKTQAEKDKDAYKSAKAEARKARSDEFNKYHTAMAAPLFAGLGQIAQAAKSFANAKLEGELGHLNAIVEMLHAWQKNAQQVGSTAQEDMKASSDEVDKILSSLQKLIDDNFKAFTINPRG